jgi:hypothetical protein
MPISWIDITFDHIIAAAKSLDLLDNLCHARTLVGARPSVFKRIRLDCESAANHNLNRCLDSRWTSLEKLFGAEGWGRRLGKEGGRARFGGRCDGFFVASGSCMVIDALFCPGSCPVQTAFFTYDVAVFFTY